MEEIRAGARAGGEREVRRREAEEAERAAGFRMSDLFSMCYPRPRRARREEGGKVERSDVV